MGQIPPIQWDDAPPAKTGGVVWDNKPTFDPKTIQWRSAETPKPPEKGLMQKWDENIVNQPLSDKLTWNGKKLINPEAAREEIDPSWRDNSQDARMPSWLGGGTWRGMYAGSIEGLGQVERSLTTPLNLALMGLGGATGALTKEAAAVLKAGNPRTAEALLWAARGANRANKVLSVPIAATSAHQAYEGIKEGDVGKTILGGANLAGAGAAFFHNVPEITRRQAPPSTATPPPPPPPSGPSGGVPAPTDWLPFGNIPKPPPPETPSVEIPTKQGTLDFETPTEQQGELDFGAYRGAKPTTSRPFLDEPIQDHLGFTDEERAQIQRINSDEGNLTAEFGEEEPPVGETIRTPRDIPEETPGGVPELEPDKTKGFEVLRDKKGNIIGLKPNAYKQPRAPEPEPTIESEVEEPTTSAVPPTQAASNAVKAVAPEGVEISKDGLVATIMKFSPQNMEFLKQQGFVSVEGLRAKDGRVQMVHKSVADLYAKPEAATTTRPNATARKKAVAEATAVGQPPAGVPAGTGNVPGPTPEGAIRPNADGSITVPNDTVNNPKFIENMKKGGFSLVKDDGTHSTFRKGMPAGSDNIEVIPSSDLTPEKLAEMSARGLKPAMEVNGKTIFRKLIQDTEGEIDIGEIWKSLKKMLGREPTQEEVESARERSAKPGDITGRIAPFTQRDEQQIPLPPAGAGEPPPSLKDGVIDHAVADVNAEPDSAVVHSYLELAKKGLDFHRTSGDVEEQALYRELYQHVIDRLKQIDPAYMPTPTRDSNIMESAREPQPFDIYEDARNSMGIALPGVDENPPPQMGQQQLPLGPHGELSTRELESDQWVPQPRPTPSREPLTSPEQLSMEGPMKDEEIRRYLLGEDATPPEAHDIQMPPNTRPGGNLGRIGGGSGESFDPEGLRIRLTRELGREPTDIEMIRGMQEQSEPATPPQGRSVIDPETYDRMMNPDLYDPTTGRPKPVPASPGSIGYDIERMLEATKAGDVGKVNELMAKLEQRIKETNGTNLEGKKFSEMMHEDMEHELEKQSRAGASPEEIQALQELADIAFNHAHSDAQPTDEFGMPQQNAPKRQIYEIAEDLRNKLTEGDENGIDVLMSEAENTITNETDPAIIKDNLDQLNGYLDNARLHGTPDDIEFLGQLRDTALDKLRSGAFGGPTNPSPDPSNLDIPIPGERGELQSFKINHDPRSMSTTEMGQMVADTQMTGHPDLDAKIRRMQEIISEDPLSPQSLDEFRMLQGPVSRDPRMPEGWREKYMMSSGAQPGEGSKWIDPPDRIAKAEAYDRNLIDQKFKNAFPVSRNPRGTQFMTSDGTELTHGDTGHWEAVNNAGMDWEDAMRKGVLRIAGDGAEARAPITEPQANGLVDRIWKMGRSLYMEVMDLTGKRNFRRFDDEDVSPSTVREWVNHFFTSTEGAVPVPSWDDYKRAARAVKEATGWGQGESRGPNQHVDEHTFITEALRIPGGLTTTGEASIPGRQGLTQILTPDFWKALPKAMAAGVNPKYFDKLDAAIRQRPIMQHPLDANGNELPSFGDKIGMRLFEMSDRPGPRAEMTAGRWLEQGTILGPETIGGYRNPAQLAWKYSIGIPIRAASRLSTTFLNELNINRTEKLLNLLQNQSIRGQNTGRAPMPGILGGIHLKSGGNIGFTRGVTPAEALDINPYHNLVLAKEVADFVNTATGHGPLKGHYLPFKGTTYNLENHAGLLNKLIFSPGLLSSRMRMMNPSTYMMASPFVRKQYMKAALSTAAAWYTYTQLIKNAAGPDAEVGDNPTSADFGKVRIGNTRMDLGGGFAQFAAAYGRMWMGGTTSSATNRFKRYGTGFQAETAKDATERFFANKLNPVAKFAYDLYDASEYQPFHVKDRMLQNVVPLYYQDLYDIYKEDPDLLPPAAKAAFAAAGFFGGGSQTYSKGESVSRFIDPEDDFNYQGGGGIRDVMPWNWGNDPGEESRPFPWSER